MAWSVPTIKCREVSVALELAGQLGLPDAVEAVLELCTVMKTTLLRPGEPAHGAQRFSGRSLVYLQVYPPPLDGGGRGWT